MTNVADPVPPVNPPPTLDETTAAFSARNQALETLALVEALAGALADVPPGDAGFDIEKLQALANLAERQARTAFTAAAAWAHRHERPSEEPSPPAPVAEPSPTNE